MLSLLVLCAAGLIIYWSTRGNSAERFVVKRFPIMIGKGKPVRVSVGPLSGNGANDVGIRCGEAVWSELTRSGGRIGVHVVSSNGDGTRVSGVYPDGKPTGFLYLLPDVHYLFHVVGARDSTAVLEVRFPDHLRAPARAEIVLCKTPADTGL